MPDSAAIGQHLGIGQAAGDVVDADRSGGDGARGHLGAHRVDRDEPAGCGEFFDDRDHALELFVETRPHRTGAGRLSADVDQVGAVGEQLLAMLDGGDRGGVQAAVGEGVGGDVDDAHHQAPTRLGQTLDGLRGYGGHALAQDEAHRLGSGRGITQLAADGAGDGLGSGLAYAAHRHTEVLALEDGDHARAA